MKIKVTETGGIFDIDVSDKEIINNIVNQSNVVKSDSDDCDYKTNISTLWWIDDLVRKSKILSSLIEEYTSKYGQDIVDNIIKDAKTNISLKYTIEDKIELLNNYFTK